MAVKFSAFTTRTGTLDASTKIVGYDDPAGTKTNVEFSLATLVDNVPTIYSADGTLSGDRNVNLGTNNLGFTNGKVGVGLTSPLYTFETKATIAGDWVARIMNESATGYGLLVRADNASSNITFATHNGAGYTTAFHGTGEVGIGTATSVPSAKLHVKGSGTTSATTSFLVEDSAGADILTVTDDGVVKIGGQAYTELHTEASAATITPDWDNGNVYTTELTNASTTFADPTNIKPGATYIIILKQDGTGSRTVSWGTKYKFPGGTAPTLTTGANKADVITLVAYSTDILMCTSVLDFVTS